MTASRANQERLASRLQDLVGQEDRSEEEQERLLALMNLFAGLPRPPDPFELFTRYSELQERFLACAEGKDSEALEEAFLALYSHLHGYEVPYTADERERVIETGGYLCHVGGLSPILKAVPFIESTTVSADFGAGNGLQGLLLQKLKPHRKTIQIEISSRLIEAGRMLQGWLGIPQERVEWVTSDVSEFSPVGIDFIYLYRPVRPTGGGNGFYRNFAARLATSRKPVVIFSVADCLRSFLPAEFEVFYGDGHLTCFRRS